MEKTAGTHGLSLGAALGRSGAALLTPRVLLPVFLLVAAALFFASGMRFYASFPNDYTWGELFINYAGGFLRRGLLGEVLLQADAVISVHILGVALFFVLYLWFTWLYARTLLRTLDAATALLLLVTPTLVLFAARDPYVFGRKDVVIHLAFFFQCVLCADALRRPGGGRLGPLTLCFCALYALAFLVHEMALFYLPLPSLLLGAAYAREGRVGSWVAVMALLVGASLAVCFLVSGDGVTRKLICASWTSRYPDFACQGGLKFIGFSLLANIHKAFGYFRNTYIMSTVLAGLLLSAVPLAVLVKGYAPWAAVRALLPHPLLRLLLLPALAAPFLLSTFTNDFGRHIQSAFLEYILFFCLALWLHPQPRAPWLERLLHRLESSAGMRWAVILGILAYGSCWRMLHCNAYGSFVQPAGLLKMLCDALGLG